MSEMERLFERIRASAARRGLVVELGPDGDALRFMSRRNAQRAWVTVATLSLSGALEARRRILRASSTGAAER